MIRHEDPDDQSMKAMRYLYCSYYLLLWMFVFGVSMLVQLLRCFWLFGWFQGDLEQVFPREVHSPLPTTLMQNPHSGSGKPAICKR